MENVVYLDVLILLNIYVSYFLFIGSAKLMSLRLSKMRLFLGSITGGIYSLIILFELHNLELVAVKLAMGISLVLLVFGTNNLIHTLKCGLYFFLVNFVYGGVMFALWTFVAPDNMSYKNGVAYFDVTALTLVISTIAAYLAITLFSMLLNKRSTAEQIISVTISLNGRQSIINAFVDTGNKLCDIFTGLPVVVVEYEVISDIFPQKLREYFQNPIEFAFDGLEDSSYSSRLKLIPVCVVGKEFALPAFKPDSLLIDSIDRAAIVAVTTTKLSNGSFQAILNTALL